MKKFEYDDILAINNIICEEKNQISTVINESNIQSALSVQYSYYNTDEEIRVALFHHLIIAHGFEDGNKRTAVTVLLYDGEVNITDDELEKITLDIANDGGSKISVQELTDKIFGVNLIDESFNNEQLKVIRNIQHQYPYVTITARNVKNDCLRVVIDDREFNGDVAQLKLDEIINDIEMIIGLNYQIKYEKALQQSELNYPNYKLYRTVLSIEPIKTSDNDIIYNDKTGYWELNGHEYVNYEDALEYL